MSGGELSGTQAGVGFGNKTDDSNPDLTEHHANTRYGIGDHDKAYSGGHSDYRSGTVGGAGSGNKMTNAGDRSDLTEAHSNTRYDMAGDTKPYNDGTEYGSGTVAGPGAGNKNPPGAKSDSTRGKLMEKVGGMMGKDDIVKQGTQKREAAAAAAKGEEHHQVGGEGGGIPD